MARVFIPTRNRPASLESVIAYLAEFSPGTKVIVADGSEETFSDRNRELARQWDKDIELEYRRYPYEMGFFDRLLDVLRDIDDSNIIMGSDDDYPLMDALQRAEDRLNADSHAVTALGATLKLSLRARNDLTIGMSASRPFLSSDPWSRARAFSVRSFSTTYAVTKREHLIERYERAKQVFLPGFFDFGVGIHDALSGNVRAVPELTYIATRNFNHSYLRQSEKFGFMKRQDEFEVLQGIISNDLCRVSGISQPEALDRAAMLLSRRVIEVMGSVPLVGGKIRHLREDPRAEAQVQAYFDLFSPGTDYRKGLLDRMRYVVDALQAVATSDDNAGEASTVASLAAQQAMDATGPKKNTMFTTRPKYGADERRSETSIPVNVAVSVPELVFSQAPPPSVDEMTSKSNNAPVRINNPERN